jgi:hypothetical protein
MKAPRYVHGYFDRHGKARWYFRRAGFKKVALPGLPWSPQFMAAYENAAAGQPLEIGSKRVKPGTMRALAISYFNSAGPISNSECLGFRSMKRSTQGVYRNVINRFCEETGKAGIKYGDISAAAMQRQHVIMLMAAKVEKPDAANGLRKALRAMMAHAVAIGLRSDDPTQGVKAIKPKSKAGFHRWTEAEIAQFEARHPIGTKARLAMALGLFTGQARQDVVLMGPQHVKTKRCIGPGRKPKAPPGLNSKFQFIRTCAQSLTRRRADI